MSKDNTTRGSQRVQALSVSQAAGASLQHMARQHGAVTAFYPVSLWPNRSVVLNAVLQAL
jgi:hypothetical protein